MILFLPVGLFFLWISQFYFFCIFLRFEVKILFLDLFDIFVSICLGYF